MSNAAPSDRVGTADEALAPEAARRAMRNAVLAQCVGLPLMFTLTTGGLTTLYAERFGARDLLVGILNGGLWAGAVVGLWTPALTQRYNKRAVLVSAQALSLLAVLPLLAVPWVAQRSSADAGLTLMTASLLAYGLAIGAFTSAWFPALMDFVPPSEVGRFFGRLRSTWQVVVLGIYLGCAAALGPDTPLWRMQWVLGALIAISAARTWLVARFPPARAGLGDRLSAILADRAFRRYLLLHALGTALSSTLAPSAVLYLRLGGYSPRAIMFAVAIGMLAAAAGFHLWGRAADRFGAGYNYRIGFSFLAAGYALWAPVSVAVWGLRSPEIGYVFAAAAFALNGLGFASVSVGLTHHAFRLTPPQASMTYLAVLPVANQGALGLGMILVGAILQALHASETRHWCNAYLAAFLLAALAALALRRLIRWVPGSDER